MSLYWTGKWLEAGAILTTKSTRFVIPIAITVCSFIGGYIVRYFTRKV